MLKLKAIFPDTKIINNESDFYLKIKILFDERESLGSICYWSTLGTKGSLMEIGLEESTGLIFEICVIASTTIYQQGIIIPYKNITEKIGLPFFDTDPWKPKINPLGYHVEFYEREYNIQEKNDFEIYAGEKNTTILFSSNTVILHIINDSILFGFDENNNLCYIHFQNMILNEEGFLEEI